MAQGFVTGSRRYRVRVVTRRERKRPFQIDILDRLTGRRRRETVRDITSVRAKRQVHQRAAEREAELNSRADGPGGPVPWADARERALAVVAAEKRPATLRAYKKVLNVLERYAEDVFTCRQGADGRRLQYVDQVTPAAARGFVSWRKAHGLAPGGKRQVAVRETTVNRDLRHLRSFWNQYFLTLGLAAENPWTDVRPLRPFRRHRTRLNRRQLDALLHEAENMDTRFHAALALAAETGPRIGELSHVTWAHINTATGAWLIIEEPCGWKPKGVEERMVGFTAETGRLLEDWRSARIAELVGQGVSADDARLVVNAGPVFGRGTTAGEDPWEREFNRDLKKACLFAGVPPITCHGLRYTLGRLAAEAGATPWQVQAMLGHAAMATTLHYVGRDKPGAARAAFEALSGSRARAVCANCVPKGEEGGREERGKVHITPNDAGT